MSDRDALRSAQRRMAGLTAAAVAGVLLVVGGVVLVVTLREQAGEAGRLLARATDDVDDLDRLPADVSAWQRLPNATERRSPNAPDWLPVGADVRRVLRANGPTVVERRVVRNGSSHLIRTQRTADGLVVQAAWSDVAHQRETTRVVAAIVVAELVGLGLSVLVGVLVARRAMGPLALAIERQRRFVADASHELRTPLTLLTTRAQLLERVLRRGEASTHEEAAALVRDAGRMSDVVTDLLLAASLESQPERREVVDLRALAADAVDSARAHAELRDVSIDGPEPGPATAVLGAAGPLRRVVDALLDNAVQHAARPGSVVVSVEMAGSRVHLTVDDDGPGIDPTMAGRLFDRFAHGATTHRERSGFGLGLSLVREIVEAHDGTVTGRSKRGGGARFDVSLPAG